jgi:hypothetical protein
MEEDQGARKGLILLLKKEERMLLKELVKEKYTRNQDKI